MSVASSDVRDLETILKPLGLKHRISRIKKLAKKLISKYGGSVPDSYDELITLPGVGP